MTMIITLSLKSSIMNEKIIIFSNPRWGTTYLSGSILRYIKTMHSDFTPVDSEFLNSYKFSQNGINNIADRDRIISELKKLYDINLSVEPTDDEIEHIFYRLLDQNRYVYKYFQRYEPNFSIDKLASVDSSIRIIPLFRRNILDVVISRIIVDHTNRWNIFEDDLPVDIDDYYVNINDIKFKIDYVTRQYDTFVTNYRRLKSLRQIESVVYYEDLSYDVRTDLTKIFPTVDKLDIIKKRVPVKIATHSIRNKILNQVDVATLINQHLSSINLKFSYDNNFNITFE